MAGRDGHAVEGGGGIQLAVGQLAAVAGRDGPEQTAAATVEGGPRVVRIDHVRHARHEKYVAGQNHRLGTDNLSNGDPGFKFGFQDKYENDGESEREDKFTTTIQAEIIDVKPNGNLVLQARNRDVHDEEGSVVTLTGMCRSEDITPANTIFSSQIAYLELNESNAGAVRDAVRRGWFPRILDWIRPF